MYISYYACMDGLINVYTHGLKCMHACIRMDVVRIQTRIPPCWLHALVDS